MHFSLPPASAVEVIESVRCVCLSVCKSSLSRLNRLTYATWDLETKFGMNFTRVLRMCIMRMRKICVHAWNHEMWSYACIISCQGNRNRSIGLCVSIHHGKRTLGQRNFTTQVAGGSSTLRRFHYVIKLICIFPCSHNHYSIQQQSHPVTHWVTCMESSLTILIR